MLSLNNRNFVISMIINGEKVPAFSATTLSIPTTPQDNFDAIVASSREKYSRPRAVVEAEIKETIEQSEKYKKELSDSGRAAGEIGAMMNPQNRQNQGFNGQIQSSPSAKQGSTSVGRGMVEKKGFVYQPSPKADFKKLKMSPDTAEGKNDRPGLKDLGKLLEQTGQADKLEQGNTAPKLSANTSSQSAPSTASGAPAKPKNHKNRNKRRFYHKSKQAK